MLVLQVPPTSLVHKWQQKKPAGQTLYRTFNCLFMEEEKFIWIVKWKNQEDLKTFLKGQDVSHSSS